MSESATEQSTPAGDGGAGGGSNLNGTPVYRVKSDGGFFALMGTLSGFYLFMIIAMVLALGVYPTLEDLGNALTKPEIQYSIKLSLITCTIAAVMSLWVAVPVGYLMSRYDFRGKSFIDSLLDIPIVLPPLVVGLALLVMFNAISFGEVSSAVEGGVAQAWTLEYFFSETLGMKVTYAVPGVILSQFMVACAFAVRTMRVTFDQIDKRHEDVALTLGCSRSQAFFNVTFPESTKGVLAAGILAWARSLGEFGPIIVFAGATPMRTEVLPTSVWLELQVGDIEAATAVSLIMIVIALLVLIFARVVGVRKAMI